MKIYISKSKESWISDRLRKEFLTYNKDITTKFISNSDIIWIISPWTWSNLSKKQLNKKLVICTIHHIDETKFGENEKIEFKQRDEYVDAYHTISDSSYSTLKRLTNKKIYNFPWWIDQNTFFHINNKDELKSKYSIEKDRYIVGSFQRDTEGEDLTSPKLSKGPDVFINNVLQLREVKQNLLVVLSGKRRHYVIQELKKYEIPYLYFEMTNLKILNELYNLLDLYIVGSRVEGGPHSIYECSITKTPILSTDVGVARYFLHDKSIYRPDNFMNSMTEVEYSYKKIQLHTIPNGMKKHIKMFEEIYEN